MGKESDEEDNEGARQRREQLTSLKEAAYELLGKAWPKDPDTQGEITLLNATREHFKNRRLTLQ